MADIHIVHKLVTHVDLVDTDKSSTAVFHFQNHQPIGFSNADNSMGERLMNEGFKFFCPG